MSPSTRPPSTRRPFDLSKNVPFDPSDHWTNECRAQGLGRVPCPRWDGSDPAGRILLLHTLLDGFGDAIQFVRYVSLVKAAHPGARIMVACRHPASPVRRVPRR